MDEPLVGPNPGPFFRRPGEMRELLEGQQEICGRCSRLVEGTGEGVEMHLARVYDWLNAAEDQWVCPDCWADPKTVVYPHAVDAPEEFARAIAQLFLDYEAQEEAEGDAYGDAYAEDEPDDLADVRFHYTAHVPTKHGEVVEVKWGPDGKLSSPVRYLSDEEGYGDE